MKRLKNGRHFLHPLTADEIRAVPPGTPIRVIWSGGNGPWTYILDRDRYGLKAISVHQPPVARTVGFLDVDLGLVGEWPLTQVALPENDATRDREVGW